jgi:hypothetical protein
LYDDRNTDIEKKAARILICENTILYEPASHAKEISGNFCPTHSQKQRYGPRLLYVWAYCAMCMIYTRNQYFFLHLFCFFIIPPKAPIPSKREKSRYITDKIYYTDINE